VRNADWQLVARVELFGRERHMNSCIVVGQNEQTNVEAFVHASSLGPMVAFGPVQQPGDGAVTSPASSAFWNRPQVVVFCNRADDHKHGLDSLQHVFEDIEQ
jgi:hypothetical protein